MLSYRQLYRFCFTIVGVLALASCARHTPRAITPPAVLPGNDFLIVPGSRIGPIVLGMTTSQLMREAGKPSKTTRFGDGTTLYLFGQLALSVYVDDGRVYRVETSVLSRDAGGGGAYNSADGSRWDGAGVYATLGGIKLGSPRSELVAALGQPGWSRVTPRRIRHETICYDDATEFWVGVVTPVYNDKVMLIGVGSCIPE